MTTNDTAAPAQAVRSGPSTLWFIQRAILGLTVMLAVTGVAAFIAHASIDATEPAVEEITIGTPAAALIGRSAETPGK